MSYSLEREQWMCIHGVSDDPCETCDVPELREIERRNDVQEATERAAKICEEAGREAQRTSLERRAEGDERLDQMWNFAARLLLQAAARIRGEG